MKHLTVTLDSHEQPLHDSRPDVLGEKIDKLLLHRFFPRDLWDVVRKPVEIQHRLIHVDPAEEVRLPRTRVNSFRAFGRLYPYTQWVAIVLRLGDEPWLDIFGSGV